MPPALHASQPSANPGASSLRGLGWFGSPAGKGMLDAEAGAVDRVLAGCPALPWLWIGAPAAVLPTGVAAGRGVVLHQRDDGLDGPIRCRLPLPLASESMGAVLLQHALDVPNNSGSLLGECARVLAPGGTLWLAALNPLTPYRARWAGAGLQSHGTSHWQAALRGAGFSRLAISVQWLGPHWRVVQDCEVEAGIGTGDRLRASFAFTVIKRVHAFIPPARVRNLSWQAAS